MRYLSANNVTESISQASSTSENSIQPAIPRNWTIFWALDLPMRGRSWNACTFKEILLAFIDEKFKGNKDFKKIIQSSAFCSEKNEIVSDNYKILKEQKIGIIPPIGGG